MKATDSIIILNFSPGLLFQFGYEIGTEKCSLCVFQPKDKPILDILEEEYLGTTEDRNQIRNGFTKLLGDMIFTIPAIQTANAHRGQHEEGSSHSFSKNS